MKQICKIVSVFFAAVLIIISVACEVGLGESVDAEAPKVAITYPPRSAVIRESFILAGTCSDDRGGVKVSVTATDSSGATYTIDAPEVTDGIRWKVEINKANEDGTYPLKDGRYTFDVTAIDGAGRKSGTSSRTVDIDNTAPVFVMKSPGSKTEATSYGSVLKVEGSIAEEHSVKYMELSIYGSDGKLLDSWTEQDISTAGSTSVTFARYSKDKGDDLNSRYGSVYDTAAGGYQNFKCGIKMWDSAGIYRTEQYEDSQSDSGTQTDSVRSGNSTSALWLNDDIYGADAGENALMGTAAAGLNGTGKSFEITDLMKIANGTSSYTEDVENKVRAILERTQTKTEETYLPIRMNKDANPTYSVMGYTFTELDAETLSKASKGGTIAFKADAGLDGTTFKPETIKIYLAGPYTAVNITQELMDELYGSPADFAGAHKDKVQVLYEGAGDEGTSMSVSSWTKSVPLPAKLTSNSVYLVAAAGTDMDGVSFVTDSGCYNGFVAYSNGVPPEILIESPLADSLANEASGVLTVSGTITAEEGTTVNAARYEIQVTDVLNGNRKLGTISDTLTGGEGSMKLEDGEAAGKNQSVHFTIDASRGKWSASDGGTADGRKPEAGTVYKYSITVYGTTDLEGSSAVSAQLDTKLPEIEITSVTPVAKSVTENNSGTELTTYYVNGKIGVTANISETNLAAVTLEITDGEHTKTYPNGTNTFVSRTDIDTTEFKDGKEITVKVTARDSAGNETTVKTGETVRYVVDQSTDLPVFEATNFDSTLKDQTALTAAAEEGKLGNVFGQVTNNKIIGNVSDDDRIHSVELFYSTEEDGTYSRLGKTLKPGTTTSSLSAELKDGTAALEEGVYWIRIEITDKDGDTDNGAVKTTVGPFVIAVDRGEPKLTVTTVSGEFKPENFTVCGTVEEKSRVMLIRDDGTAVKVSGDGRWTDSFEGQTEGKTVTYTATDAYGQSSSAAFTYKIDRKPPTVAEGWSQAESDREWTNKTSATYKVPVSDTWDTEYGIALDANNYSGIESVSLKLYRDGTFREELTMSKTSQVLEGNEAYGYYSVTATFEESGEYTAEVYASDLAGNTTTEGKPLAVLETRIDLDAPDIGEVTPKYKDIGAEEYAALTDSEKFTLTTLITDEKSGTGRTAVYDGTTVIYDSEKEGVYGKVTKSVSGDYHTFSLDKTLITTGNHTYKITAYDKAGNIKTAETAVSVDVTGPVLKVNDPAPYVSVNGEKKYNGKITVSGTATDETALGEGEDEISWEILDMDGNPLSPAVKGTSGLKGGMTSEWSVTVDTREITDGAGTWQLKVTAKDKVGNVTDYTRELAVDQSTDIPEITLSNASKDFKGEPSTKAGENLFGMGSDIIYGTAVDDDGIKSITYIIDKDTENEIPPKTVTFSGGTSCSFTIDLASLGVSAGDHTLDVFAEDTSEPAIKTTDEKGVTGMKFGYDNDVPTISVTKCNGQIYSNDMFAGTNFDVWFTVSDSTSTDGSGLTVECSKIETKNESGGYETVDLPESGESAEAKWDGTEKVFIHSVKNTEKDYRRTYTVNDKYGRKATAQILYRVDNLKPKFIPENICINGSTPDYTGKISLGTAEGVWYNNAALKIIGEDGALVENHPGTLTITVNGEDVSVNTGNGNAFTTTITFPEGSSEITFNAVDEAGNAADSLTKKLNVDLTSPSVTEIKVSDNNINSEDKDNISSSPVTLTCTVSDKNGALEVSGIKKVRLLDGTAVLYGNDDSSSDKANVSIDGDKYTFTLKEAALTTGEHQYTVEATDKAGNITNEKSATVSIDVDAPSITYNGYSPSVSVSETAENGTISVANGIVTVTGSVKDETALAKTDVIVWEILNSDETSLSSSVGGSINLPDTSNVSANWSFELDTTKVLDTKERKTFKIKITAKDAVGNKTVDTSKEIIIDQRTNIPSVVLSNAEKDVKEESGITLTKNLFGMGSTTIYGSATDDDGIKSIEYVIDEGQSSEIKGKIEMEGKTPSSKSFSIDLSSLEDEGGNPHPLSSGVHTLNITVTDISEKIGEGGNHYSSPVTEEIGSVWFGYDTAVPTISVTTVNGTSYTNGMFVPENFEVTGKVSDDSGVKSVTLKDSSDSEILLTADGTFTESKVTTSGEGPATRTYVVTDKFGRTSETSITFDVDTVSPAFNTANLSFEGANNQKSQQLTYAEATAEGTWFTAESIKITGAGSTDDNKKALVETNPDKNSITVKGENTESTEYTFNAGTNNGFNVTISFPQGKAVSVMLNATDKAKNSPNPTEFYLHIDTTSPEVNSVSFDLSDKVINADTFSITPKVEEETSGIQKILVGLKPGFNESEAIGSGTVSEEVIVCTMWDSSDSAKQHKDSSYTVYVRAVDNAGNVSSDFEAGSFIYDRTLPAATVKTPVSGSTVYKTITVSGTVEDANLLDDNGSKPELWVYNDGSSRWVTLESVYAGAATNPVINGSEWSVTVDTTKIAPDAVTGAEKTIKIHPVFKDKAGNVTAPADASACTLVIDQYKDRPVITFFELTGVSGSTRKYTASITGTVKDDDGLTEFKVSSEELASLDAWRSYNQPDGTLEFTKETGGFTYTPEDSVKATIDGEKTLYFYVKDKNGGEFFTQTGGSDVTAKKQMPYVRFKGAESDVDNNSVISYKADGNTPAVDKVEYVCAGSVDEVKSKYTAGSFTEMSGSTTFGGTKKRYAMFRLCASDTNDIDTSAGSVIAKITNSNNGTDKTVVFTYESVSGEGLSGNTYKRYFKSAIVDFGEKTGNDFEYASDNNYTFTITVKDTSGLMGTKTPLLVIDNTAPEIKITSPKSDTLVYGDVSISGTATDTYSTVSALKYLIGTDTVKEMTSEERLSKIQSAAAQYNSGTESAWTFLFDGNTYTVDGTDCKNEKLPYTGEMLMEYSSSKIDDVDRYNLPVYLYAEDDLGNYTVKEDYTIKYDPYADRPRAEVLYPSDNDIVSGTIRVSGSATDDKTVGSVYIQIRPAGKVSYEWADAKVWVNELKDNESNPYYTVLDTASLSGSLKDSSADPYFWGIKCTGTASWSFEINAGGNLQKSETETETSGIYAVEVRACAIDEDGKLGSWSEKVVMTINPSAPAFGSDKRYLAQYDNAGSETARLEYTSGIYLKDSWYIVTSVQHSSGIKELYFQTSSDGSAYSDPVYLVGTNSSGKLGEYTLDGSTDVKDIGSDSDKGYYLKLPIGSASGTGISYVKISATSSGDISGNAVYSVNYDNEAPEISNLIQNDISFETGSSLVNSDGRLEIGSTVEDNGSGFSKALFYFTRKIGDSGTDAYTRMYDPMINCRTNPYYRTSDKDSIGIDILDASENIVDGIDSDELASGAFIYGKKYTVSRESSDSLTISEVNSHIRVGNLVKIGGTYHTLKSVSNSGKTFTFTPACDTSYTTAFFPYAQVVDNTGSESLKSVSEAEFVFKNGDDGDGMPESITKTGSTWKWTADIHANFMPDGPVSFHLFVFDESGNVAAKTIDNCKIATSAPRLAKLFLGTDLSGNGDFEPSEFEEYNIRNVTNMYQSDYTLKTAGYQTVTVSSEGTVTVEDSARSAFKIKDQLAIVPEFTGGNGTIKMVYKKDDSTTGDSSTDRAVTKSAGDGFFESSSDREVTIKAVPVGSTNGQVVESKAEPFILSNSWIANGKESGTVSSDTDGTGKSMSFTFWDSTEGLECGETSQSCYVQVTDFVIDLVDDVNPKVIIDPFFWNGKGFAENGTGFRPKNSLYYPTAGVTDEITNTVNGHIELESDLPSAFTGDTGEYDRDPKVSGQIVIRGTAYDDVRLGELYVSFDDFTFVGALSDGSVSDYYLVAKYDVSGKWTCVGDEVSKYGWGFKVLDSDDVNATHTFMSQKGHSVDWEFYIDTAKMGSVCGTDKSFKILACDAKGKNQSDTKNASKPDETTTPYTTVAYADKTYEQMNVQSYRMDVVPYISSIHTTQRTNSGLKDSNIRSASGKYSVIKGTVSDFITVNGFNLKNISSAIIVSSSDLENYPTALTSTSGSELVVKTPSDDKEIYLSNNGTKSGYLELFASNGIRTLNNINNNDAHGTYALKGSDEKALVSDYAYMPNRMNEADYTNTKNVTLTDDRYIRFFDMKDTGMKNGYYPVMLMNGDNPVFGYVNKSGGTSGTPTEKGTDTYAGNYQPSHAMPQRSEYNGITGVKVYTEYLINASTWDSMGMAVDEGGRYYNVSVYNRDGSAMSLIYDRYAELHTVKSGPNEYTGMGWGSGTGYSDYKGDWSHYSNNNALTLDSVNYKTLLTERYTYPKLVAKGNSKTDTASVYMSYYDDATGEILFRNFQIGTTVSEYALGNSYKDIEGTQYKQYVNFEENTGKSATWNSGRLTVTDSGSKYFSMGVTSDNHVVIGYYDESLSKIVLKYSTYEITGANPTSTVDWTTSTASFPEYVGSYLSLAVDGTSVHLAAFDSYDSNLTYMYMPSYNGNDLTAVTVDQASSVGQWTQIKVRNKVPYISYYNSTETGSRDAIKIAYSNSSVDSTITGGVDIVPGSASGTGYTTGAWEYMTVPSITPPQGGDTKFQNVCLDFDSADIPVVGYLGTNLEFGKWLSE